MRFSAEARRSFAAALIALILTALASTLLPPDCDGLPGFEDNDGDPDALALWIRVAVAASPGRIARPAPPNVAVCDVPAVIARLPEAVAVHALPERSPPSS